jgi:hypothetical protein
LEWGMRKASYIKRLRQEREESEGTLYPKILRRYQLAKKPTQLLETVLARKGELWTI